MITREEFAALPTYPGDDRLILPCGPDRGCDYDDCAGWASIRDGNPIDLRHWTAAEIAEARAFRDRPRLRFEHGVASSFVVDGKHLPDCPSQQPAEFARADGDTVTFRVHICTGCLPIS